MASPTMNTILHLLATSTDIPIGERSTLISTLASAGLLTPAEEASTSSTLTNLRNLVNAIPIAENGRVISSQYHNSLRAALLAIAGQLGADPTSGTETLTFAPSFLPSGDEPPWSLSVGVATKPPEADRARGWFPLQLPEGVRLQSMIVNYRKTESVRSFQVQLLQQPLNDISTTALITVSLGNAAAPFQVTGSVQVAEARPAALEESVVINNSAYKYLVMASVDDQEANTAVQIFTIRVTYSR